MPGQGISVELIDLRTLWPWDQPRCFESAARTGRLLVVHEAVQVAGFGAEVAATVPQQAPAAASRAWARRASPSAMRRCSKTNLA